MPTYLETRGPTAPIGPVVHAQRCEEPQRQDIRTHAPNFTPGVSGDWPLSEEIGEEGPSP